MKKKLLLLLALTFLVVLVGCRNNEKIENEISNQLVIRDSNKNNADKKLEDLPIKQGKIGKFFEISVLIAEKISKEEIIIRKILPEDKIKKEKAYITIKYKVKDLRAYPDFNSKPYPDQIESKSLDGEIVKKEELGRFSKKVAIISEIIEVDKIGKKIDLSFKLGDEKLDIRVIL